MVSIGANSSHNFFTASSSNNILYQTVNHARLTVTSELNTSRFTSAEYLKLEYFIIQSSKLYRYSTPKSSSSSSSSSSSELSLSSSFSSSSSFSIPNLGFTEK